MKIQVTQEHIRKGRRGCGSSCAIALAIQDACRTDEVHVGRHHVDFIGSDGPLVELPREAFTFVMRFDLRLPVAPFEFDLPLETAEATSPGCL